MRVALERTVMSPETYIEVCVSAGLSVPNIEAVQRGLPRSLYSVCAVDKLGRTLGFARVVGDGGVFFEIVDVAVRKECQGNGIGRTLMVDVLAWLEREAHPTAFVGLSANAGSSGFYKKLGFEPRSIDEPYMMHARWNRLETRA